MTYRDRKARSKRRLARSKGYALAAGALGLLFLAAGLWLSLRPAPSTPRQLTPEPGAPRLAVDREAVDLGVQPVDRLVTASFQLTNLGDAPLHILGEPSVQLLEGC